MATVQPLEYIDITFEDFLKALEENGFQHIRNSYYQMDPDGKVYAGCAIGQAAVNLGVQPSSLQNALDDLADVRIAEKIVEYNDGSYIVEGEVRYHSYKQVVAYAKRFRAKYGDRTLGSLVKTEYKVRKEG